MTRPEQHTRARRRPPIAIAGAGHAGGSLAVLLAARNWPVLGIWSRRRARARTIARRIRIASGQQTSCPTRVERLGLLGDVVLLAVPDGALAAVASRLAAAVPCRDRVFLHLSGAHGRSMLEPLAARGARTGVCHPLAVLPATSPAADLLAGAGFAVDGDTRAVAMARRLVRDLGGHPFTVRPHARPAYHLAASLVANDTLALVDLATALLRRAGLPADVARASLAHLLAGTAAALEHASVEQALTGPVARGDAETLRLHLTAAEATGGPAAALHRALSRVLIDIARRSGRLDAAGVRRLIRELRAAPRRRP